MGLNIQDLEITSPAFDNGGRMDSKYARDGDDISPPLEWSGVPEGTAELVIVVHDPDAPLPYGFCHGVLSGIPADVTEIPEGGGNEYTRGKNDFGDEGYGGPMPPEGHGPHHYYFWIYALDTETEGPLSRREFLDRYGDNIIEQNRVIGVYER
ncbi:MAG: YbhB/YbcL family Raf kinase inhibitor-like protein [Nitriliruptorales bacterium]|nr:YbhB/YbcL family Raf kinase inhibitor-like protein [Nitriliruptorales bacterium]